MSWIRLIAWLLACTALLTSTPSHGRDRSRRRSLARPQIARQLSRISSRIAPGLLRSSGARLCRRQLAQIRRETRRGERVCVVFDIDNTLVDTRHRTLAAVKSFARAHPELAGSSTLGQAKLHQMRYDGAKTGGALGLSSASSGELARHWRGFFWNPGHFAHDKPIKETVRLAHAAKAAGAEVYYLTGRVKAFAPGSVKQLAALGLPDVDRAHVLCKPSVKVRTGAFKRSELKKLQRRRRVAWFISDATSDIAAAAGLGIGCVLVDFPVGPDRGATLPRRTPRLRPKL